MKLILKFLAVATVFSGFGCRDANKADMSALIDRSLEKAATASLAMARSLESDTTRLPRTFQGGNLVTSNAFWWCSGFFPGTLWYLYENAPSEELKRYAMEYTDRVEPNKYVTDNHDVGFIIFCSFGNGLRILGLPEYREVIMEASKSLSTRYVPQVGAIRSWDFNKHIWQCPVIIDNMMNLEMLLWAADNGGEERFGQIARSHADKTIANHFRDDYSCYHVVDYDTLSGNARLRQTHQGYADPSAWARGEAWALYGYTMVYRMTGEERYLRQAENIARFIIDHPRLPEDGIPYWDFDAPGIPDQQRDASAGAITASALVELSTLTKDVELSKKSLALAEKQIRTLSSDEYFAAPGTNGNFILKHSTGSMPHNSEVDVPLTYADYYYVEAMMRYKALIL